MVYIMSATQISAQQPLSERWMTEPQHIDGPYVRSQDPAFRQWLNPLESRRLGRLLKRALVTATEAMSKAGIRPGDQQSPTQPDAIVTGTGYGCIENTEQLLNQMCSEGDETLKPTMFMQSTHNTISSLIAINGHYHGYNSTYSQKAVSFDCALLDAFLQLRLGDIDNALVTGNDEMTPTYFSILQRAGLLGQAGQVPATEASVAMMLSNNGDGALCRLLDMKMVYGPENAAAAASQYAHQPDAILLGTNGTTANDHCYGDLLTCLPSVPLLHYKHLFGEGNSASALGLYAATHICNRGEAPAFMRCDGHDHALPVDRLLVVNHSEGRCFSFVTIEREHQ